MHIPLFEGALCLSLFLHALLCVLSSFAIILKRTRERELVALLLLSYVSCYCICSVALPRGAVGWAAVLYFLIILTYVFSTNI